MKYKLMDGCGDKYITNINRKYYRIDNKTFREYPLEILSMYAGQLIGEDGKPYQPPKNKQKNDEIENTGE